MSEENNHIIIISDLNSNTLHDCYCHAITTLHITPWIKNIQQWCTDPTVKSVLWI